MTDSKSATFQVAEIQMRIASGSQGVSVGDVAGNTATAVPVTLELIRTRVHPEDLIMLEKMVEQARDGRSAFQWQYRLVMPDHSIKYLHAVARATRDQDGRLE
jgi:hypothetical protein